MPSHRHILYSHIWNSPKLWKLRGANPSKNQVWNEGNDFVCVWGNQPGGPGGTTAGSSALAARAPGGRATTSNAPTFSIATSKGSWLFNSWEGLWETKPWRVWSGQLKPPEDAIIMSVNQLRAKAQNGGQRGEPVLSRGSTGGASYLSGQLYVVFSVVFIQCCPLTWNIICLGWGRGDKKMAIFHKKARVTKLIDRVKY